MKNVQIMINGNTYQVTEGITILQAARDNEIHIPTLCSLEGLDPRANCRMCVVEVEGMRTLQPSCATKVKDGMVIQTDSELVRRNRKHTLELILSSHAVDCHHCLRIGSSKCADLDPVFCEMCFFCDCVKDGFCELQSLAREYGVDVMPYEMHPYDFEEDTSLGSLIRNPNKCIKCRRCVDVCGEIQTVHTLSVENRGREMQVVPALGAQLKDSPCVRCGRCVTVCPTGAVYMKEHKDEFIYHAHKYGVTTVAQISNNVCGELEKLFHMEPGSLQIEKIADGLKKIGIDLVVGEDFGVKIAQQKGQELLEKKLKTTRQPVILTSSFAAQNFIRQYFKELEDLVVSYPSSQQAFGSYIREIYAPKQGIFPENIYTVSITNDNENGADAHENGSVDLAVNARELYRIFLRTGVDLKNRKGVELDVLGDAGDPAMLLFDAMEWNMEREPQRREESVCNQTVQVAYAHNLGQARMLLEQVNAASFDGQIIRIQA